MQFPITPDPVTAAHTRMSARLGYGTRSTVSPACGGQTAPLRDGFNLCNLAERRPPRILVWIAVGHAFRVPHLTKPEPLTAL